MRHKNKVIIIIPILLLLIGTIYFTLMKPFNVSKEVWSEGIQIAKVIDNAVKNEEPTPDGILELMDGWESIDKRLNDSEREIKQVLLKLHIAQLQLRIADIRAEGTDKTKEDYNKAYKEVEKTFGKVKLLTSNVNKSFLEKLESSATVARIKSYERDEEKKQEFIASTDIELTADEVQYNMANNLDRKFYLAGRVELCDYYNYGFTDEKSYFCGKIIPIDNSATDPWYLYFSRDSFQSVYESLLSGSVDLRIAAEVPSTVYKNGQGNMAWVRNTNSYQ